jgi:diguanylate cyclase (GGDEF)-like protein
MNARTAIVGVPATPDDLLSECDREPIHLPGAIQPHGALLAVDASSLRVNLASANLSAFLEIDAVAALGQPLEKLLGPEITALLPGAAQARRANDGGSWVDAGLASGRVRLRPFLSGSTSIGIDIVEEPQQHSVDAAVSQAQRIIQSLRLSRTSVGLCRIAVNDVRRITGFDRVMVYRFDDDGSGAVIAEDLASDTASFLGLKYPAADIPKQARRLYMLQRIRVIPDREAAPVALLAASGQRADEFDLSASWLRASSPVHLQYLRNMGVTATAVVSLIVAGKLWGMLVCHHGSPRAVNADQRTLLDLVGQVISVMLGSLAEGEVHANRLQRQRALSAIGSAVAKSQLPIEDCLAASAAELLNLVAADGAVIMIADRVIAVGRTPAPESYRAIMAMLSALVSEDITASSSLPDAMTGKTGHLDGYAGALLLPLPSCANGSIAWFRRELNLTVSWAGDPAKQTLDPTTGRLEPRQSFASWQEEVRGRSEPWTEADLTAARELRRVVDESMVRRNEGELLRTLHDSDPLTGLLNRHAIELHLEVIDQNPLAPSAALLVVNVDRFRNVNDSLGHRAGDALLVQIAHRIQLVGQPGELIARLATDEFGVLSSVSNAQELAARIVAVFVQPFEIAKQMLQMYASVGGADSAAASGGSLGLLHAAETAMRQSKMSGGNRVSFFEQALREEASRQLVVEQSLAAALRSDREQLQLALQPIIDVSSGALRGWEVLLRWEHPTLGNVSPAVFIPVAESSGLIEAVGDFVLEAAFRYLVEAPLSADPDERDGYLSVNVSPLQLKRAGFARGIESMLEARGITPSRVCIEVTEGVFTDAAAVAVIGEIRRLGVLVAVDDFGIGYSSLSTLQRLPADIVKLDRSFLPDQAATAASDGAFLGAVVLLAHTAGLKVVIEGVETQMQLDAVLLAGVDAIQGFFLARPMSSEAAIALACQSRAERNWNPKLVVARRFKEGAHLRS